MSRAWAVALAILVTVGCAGGPPKPAPFTPGAAACVHCRMVVTNHLFAAQVVSPGEPPKFFDDIGCLVEYLSRNTRFPPSTIAYVVDHQTGAWIPAASALYTRNLQVATPMSSHLIAHGSAATQQADPLAASGARATARDLLPLDFPDGTR